jgi:SAM-dependent methyltransferase
MTGPVVTDQKPERRISAEENERLQRGHMARMKAVMEDDASRPIVLSLMHRRYQTYLRDVFEPTAGRLLDLGCGFADVWLGYLRERGFTYFGLDLNEEVIEHMSRALKSQGPDTYIRRGHIESLPFESGFFDVVFASHILEHTIDIRRTLAEIARVLKPGGYLAFAVPCGPDDEPAHVYKREKDEWVRDLDEQGFTIEVSGQFDFNLNEFYGRARPRQ